MCMSSPKPSVQLPPGFNSAYYLQHNPDVAAAGYDGAQHYLKWGHNEGRPGVYPEQDRSLQLQQQQFNFQQQMANAARAAEQARANRVQQGMNLIDQKFNFGDDFFKQREQDYLNWANPQLDEQHKEANEQLAYAMSRMGHGQGSTLQTDRFGQLQQGYDQNRANIADQAKDVSNQARGLIGDQRAQLVSLAQMAADPTAVNNQIGRAMSDVQAYRGFDPTSQLNPMFQNITAGLGSFLDGMRMGGGGRFTPPPIYGSSGTNSGSGRVVK